MIRTRNLQDWNLTRYRCANRSKGEPPCDVGGVRTHARRLVPKTSASGRSRELRPLGHIINVRDSDRVRTRIDLGQRIDPATLAGVDFKSTALTTVSYTHLRAHET